MVAVLGTSPVVYCVSVVIKLSLVVDVNVELVVLVLVVETVEELPNAIPAPETEVYD